METMCLSRSITAHSLITRHVKDGLIDYVLLNIGLHKAAGDWWCSLDRGVGPLKPTMKPQTNDDEYCWDFTDREITEKVDWQSPSLPAR